MYIWCLSHSGLNAFPQSNSPHGFKTCNGSGIMKDNGGDNDWGNRTGACRRSDKYDLLVHAGRGREAWPFEWEIDRDLFGDWLKYRICLHWERRLLVHLISINIRSFMFYPFTQLLFSDDQWSLQLFVLTSAFNLRDLYYHINTSVDLLEFSVLFRTPKNPSGYGHIKI